MNYDIYLFDLDGTLLDLGNIGSYSDQILVQTLRKLKIDKFPNRSERKELWISEKHFQNMLNKWGIACSVNFWKYYDKTDFEERKILLKNKKISLFKDVKNVLELIYTHKENKKLAICTNTSDYIVDFFLIHFKIKKYFQEIFSMGATPQEYAKPSPNGILTILKKFEFNSQNQTALMIGDSIHDIKAAKKAKISSCLINRHLGKELEFYRHWDYQPDFIIENLFELCEL
ncbi:MAG: HAD family hydrolase [Promethearchaeota archaeon]